MNTSLHVMSLNIEGEKHVDRFMPFVKSFWPDVLFLQEVPQHCASALAEELGLYLVRYVPMKRASPSYKGRDANNSVWGLASYVSSHVTVLSEVAQCYHQAVPGRLPDDTDEHCEANRYLQRIEILLGGVSLQLFQTHFTWSQNGEPTEKQRSHMRTVLAMLRRYENLALFGDLNAPRGESDVWDMLARYYNDHIPTSVTTTLDEQLHRVGTLKQLVVDACFASPSVRVREVEVVSGLSDHKGICAELRLAQ